MAQSSTPRPLPSPDRSVTSILNHAFQLYKGVVLQGALLLIMVSIVESLLLSFLGTPDFMSNVFDTGFPGTVEFNIGTGSSWRGKGSLGFLGVLLTPFWIGYLYLISRYNCNYSFDISDYFIGYKQNLVQIVLYGVISSVILFVATLFLVVPVFFVMPLLMLGYPLLLFKNASAVEALKTSVSIAKDNYSIFLGVCWLGGLMSLCGLIFFLIGIIFTIPFIIAVMFSTYCAYFGTPKPNLN